MKICVVYKTPRSICRQIHFLIIMNFQIHQNAAFAIKNINQLEGFNTICKSHSA